VPGGVTTWPSAASSPVGTSRDVYLQVALPSPGALLVF
jgi:hypothetical protein